MVVEGPRREIGTGKEYKITKKTGEIEACMECTA